MTTPMGKAPRLLDAGGFSSAGKIHPVPSCPLAERALACRRTSHQPEIAQSTWSRMAEPWTPRLAAAGRRNRHRWRRPTAGRCRAHRCHPFSMPRPHRRCSPLTGRGRVSHCPGSAPSQWATEKKAPASDAPPGFRSALASHSGDVIGLLVFPAQERPMGRGGVHRREGSYGLLGLPRLHPASLAHSGLGARAGLTFPCWAPPPSPTGGDGGCRQKGMPKCHFDLFCPPKCH